MGWDTAPINKTTTQNPRNFWAHWVNNIFLPPLRSTSNAGRSFAKSFRSIPVGKSSIAVAEHGGGGAGGGAAGGGGGGDPLQEPPQQRVPRSQEEGTFLPSLSLSPPFRFRRVRSYPFSSIARLNKWRTAGAFGGLELRGDEARVRVRRSDGSGLAHRASRSRESPLRFLSDFVVGTRFVDLEELF